MDIFGFVIEWRGGKPLGNLRATQGHIIDLEKRVKILEGNRSSKAGDARKRAKMDSDIADVFAGGGPVFAPSEDALGEFEEPPDAN